MQIVCFISSPAVGNLHLVFRFQPFINTYTGYAGIFPVIVPAHRVPFQHFIIVNGELRLQHQRISETIIYLFIFKRHAVHGIAGKAVCAQFHELFYQS